MMPVLPVPQDSLSLPLFRSRFIQHARHFCFVWQETAMMLRQQRHLWRKVCNVIMSPTVASEKQKNKKQQQQNINERAGHHFAAKNPAKWLPPFASCFSRFSLCFLCATSIAWCLALLTVRPSVCLSCLCPALSLSAIHLEN